MQGDFQATVKLEDSQRQEPGRERAGVRSAVH